MNDEIKKLAQMTLAEIANARQYSQNPTPHDLFISSETIVSCLASLVSPLMDAETAYRQKIKIYMEEGDSNAKAEGKAKAEQEYKDWKKLEMVFELAREQIQLIKKFGTMLNDEYKRS